MKNINTLSKRVEDLECATEENSPANNIIIYELGTNPEYANDQEDRVIFLIPDNHRDDIS